MACDAEAVLCVRSDPVGNAEPTRFDLADARRVVRAMTLIDVPVLDYLILGSTITSLAQRRQI